MIRSVYSVAVFLIAYLLPSHISAQSTWLTYTDRSSVTVEWAKPSFSGPEDYAFYSSNLYLSGRYEVMPGVFLAGELPFAAYGYCLPSANEWVSGRAFGNPSIGIEAGDAKRTWFAEAGARIPVTGEAAAGSAKSDALAAAAFADPERYPAFAGNVVPVQVALNANPWISPGTLRLRARLGMWRYFPLTGEEESSASTQWSTAIVFRTMNFSLGAAYSGQYFFESAGMFSERALHQWGFLFGAHYEAANVDFAIRLPLNAALTGRVNYTFNLNAAWGWE